MNTSVSLPPDHHDRIAALLGERLGERLTMALENDRHFAVAWSHTEAESMGRGTWSPSQWDLAVVWYAQRAAGFDRQELATIVRAHRIAHWPDDPDVDDDYVVQAVTTASGQWLSSRELAFSAGPEGIAQRRADEQARRAGEQARRAAVQAALAEALEPLTEIQRRLVSALFASEPWCLRRRVSGHAAERVDHLLGIDSRDRALTDFTRHVAPPELADLELLLSRVVDRDGMRLGSRTAGTFAHLGLDGRSLRRAVDTATLAGLAGKVVKDGAMHLVPTDAGRTAILGAER